MKTIKKSFLIIGLTLGMAVYGQQGFFSTSNQPGEPKSFQTTNGPEPELPPGFETGVNDDGSAPIDGWLFLLPLAGLVIGYYYMRKGNVLTTD